MAAITGNGLWTTYKENILGKDAVIATQIDLEDDTISGMFVDHGTDTPDTTDDFLSDIAAGAARVPALASCPTLGSKTIGTLSAGTFDAADLVFSSLSGNSVESLILFKNSGTDTTSPLILWLMTFASGMPLTPNGGNVTVVWDANGIFTL